MAAHSSRTYPLSVEQMYPLCYDSLGQAGALVNKGETTPTRIVAATPIAWLGTEPRLRFEISLVPLATGGTQVNQDVFPLAAFGNKALIGGGRSAERRGEQFLTALDEAVSLFMRNEFAPRAPNITPSLSYTSGCLGMLVCFVLGIAISYLISTLVNIDTQQAFGIWWFAGFIIGIGLFYFYYKIFARPPQQ